MHMKFRSLLAWAGVILSAGLVFSCTPNEGPGGEKKVPATSLTLDKDKLEMTVRETATLTATVLPENTTDRLEWKSSEETVAVVADGEVTALAPGEAVITASAGSQKAECKVKVGAAVLKGAVDLGLKVLWADHNVGAKFEYESGRYYAWGAVETTSDYWWDTYVWSGDTQYTLTKYNNREGSGVVDGLTDLKIEDDVARKVMGEPWRMPTYEEVRELLDNCTWAYEEAVVYSERYSGQRVTGPNGKSIFLPAAGIKTSTGFNNYGREGTYWTSHCSAHAGNCLQFGGSVHYVDNKDRCYGLTVRAVADK